MSSRVLFAAAFGAGLAAIAWVGYGYLASQSLLALAMTGVIAAVFCAGALELRRVRRDTAALDAAFAAPPAGAEALAGWLAGLPGGLRAAVERRLDGDRVALPGPALAPTLVGLLVLLGMLGTFLGMVATLRGAVSALQGTTDLATMRAALAAPVQGLGVAFGTSVAGVAASAMLGLMLALARRERTRSATLLDGLLAGALRPFTRAQRDEAAQARMLATLETAMARLEQHGDRLGAQLLAGQQRFHAEAGAAYGTLAQSVERTLQASLGESARAAGAMVATLADTTLAGIARETAALQGRLAATVEQQTAALRADALAQDRQRVAAWTDALDRTSEAWHRQLETSRVSDNAQLAERERLLAQMAALLATLQQSAATQQLAAEAVAGSAIEVASLGEAFGAAVAQFGAGSEALTVQLQRIEAALDRSATRGDEQLAYYVAQAREIVDLSLASQRQIVGELQKVAAA